MAKTLIIGTQDFTSYFPRAGYEVEYTAVNGGQGGITLNGESVDDELAVKAVVVLHCIPLNEVQMKTLLGQIYSSVYHRVTYYDPRVGGNRTITARRNVTRHKYRGYGANGIEYWTGVVVTLTEK